MTRITLTIGLLLLFACGAWLLAQNSPPAAAPRKPPEVPAKAAAVKNPLARKAGAAEAGRESYNDHCAMCHGEAGNAGLQNSIDLTSSELQKKSDGALFWYVTHGNLVHGMPSWSSLPEKERWQLVTYVRELQKKAVQNKK